MKNVQNRKPFNKNIQCTTYTIHSQVHKWVDHHFSANHTQVSQLYWLTENVLNELSTPGLFNNDHILVLC